jgi:hypothetical protein
VESADRQYRGVLGWWIIAVLAVAPAWAQFSPGPLSRAHNSLDGPTHCTDCHSLGAGTRRFKCLSCHTEIRRRLAEHRGLHPALVKEAGGDQQCAKCHSEHNGSNFVPIRWDVDLSDFDHLKTGYALEGAHARLKCTRCHKPENIQPAAAKGLLVKNLKRTYLGLALACQSCHQDPHTGQLGADCQRCHNPANWKDVRKFNHALAKFQLTGAHSKVVCQKCHPRIAEPKPHIKFTGLQFQNCAPCHNDPHRGAFAGACQSCHNDIAWKPAVRVASSFDHSRTKFPLDGKHAGVACAKCHRSSNFKEPVAHALCMDCHKDQHNGQFLARADKGECGSCHRAEGWKPSTFDVARHTATKYPLEARHAAVACGKCHLPAALKTVYRIKYDRCLDCHADVHKGQFAGQPYLNRCEECHTVHGFRPARFSLARHERTRFPLRGAHAAIACAECHNNRSPNYPPPPVRYRVADLSCTGCHEDPHRAQFKIRMASLTTGGRTAGCQACHTERSWHDLAGFDHATTLFPLVGAHRGVPCEQCHRPPNLAVGTKGAVFHAAPGQCSGCHEDIHGGQFSPAASPADCGKCHNVFKWRPANFDHNTRSAFLLNGAHRNVACGKCHTNYRLLNGKRVLFYKPAPKECSACHESQIATRSE